MGGGYAFNRRFFHTKIDACISCILWENIDENITEFELTGFDIDEKNGQLINEVRLPVKRIGSLFSEKFYDKRKFDDDEEGGIIVEANGLELGHNVKVRVKPKTSNKILGYLVANSSGFDNPDLQTSLAIGIKFNGNGFYLRKDNYLEKLPMFAAGRYITYNRQWTERARIMKSADDAERFLKDIKNGKLEQFLLKCLLFTCIEMQNHMRSFQGSDGRFYRNELCLDTTHGETVASIDLKRLKANEKEKEIISLYERLIRNIKETEEYDAEMTYGLYQIYDEINVILKDELDRSYPKNKAVNSDLSTMKGLCKSYYNTEIVPTLFEYELLK